MPTSIVSTFEDPYSYQAAVRGAEVRAVVTARGDFRAKLMRIDLTRLWLQRGRESLPWTLEVELGSERRPIFFLAGNNQSSIHHNGIELSPGDIVILRPGSTIYHRTGAARDWMSMSLMPNDLVEAGRVLVGRELAPPSETYVARPPRSVWSRLVHLHAIVGRLAETAPAILSHPEVARALERELEYAMITCLAHGTPVESGLGHRHHRSAMVRLEEFLEANAHRPLYLSEICAAVGVSERTLRVCCQEYLGLGPIRYLWLRRMQMVRRALAMAEPNATVTSIAADYGFWELGRFSVAYRKLFGESPSTTLRRRATQVPGRHKARSAAALPLLHSHHSAGGAVSEAGGSAL
jgi:AraC-like DNA-binding protein